MDSRFDHLNQDAAELCRRSDTERLRKFAVTGRTDGSVSQTGWVDYPAATKVLERLEVCLRSPADKRRKCLMIGGEPGNGKTTLLKWFQHLHPAHNNPNLDGITIPALMVEAPAKPSEKELYAAILHTLFLPGERRKGPDHQRGLILHTLKRVKVGMLVIDNLERMLPLKPSLAQRQILVVLKSVANQFQIPIVTLGNKDAFTTMMSNDEIVSHFEPATLPYWSADGEYFSWLGQVERFLPLKKPSNLAEESLGRKIFGLSEGTVGSLARVLVEATRAAIGTTEQITPGLLERVFPFKEPVGGEWGSNHA